MNDQYKAPTPLELRAALYDLSAACDRDIFTDAPQCAERVTRAQRAIAAANAILRGDIDRNSSILVPRKLLATLLDMSQQHVQDIESGIEDAIYRASENQDLPEKRAALDAAQQLYRDATLGKVREESEPPVDFQKELALLGSKGLTFAQCVEALGEDRDSNPFASAAHKLYGREGELEIDPATIVSQSNDGAYVLAWCWVSNDEAGIEPTNGDDSGAERVATAS